MPGSAEAALLVPAFALALLAGTSTAAAVPRTGAEGAGTAGADGARARVAFTFTDDRIDESSGLVIRGDDVLTTNDSGDGPFLYTVDGRSGDTVAVTTYADEDPLDVEALAPGPGGAVWVGDIGDNARSRSTITVHRVARPGGGRSRSARYELAYPDGPHDAETLLAHPRTGRLYVVTKVPVVGGGVYAAPPELESGRTNRLERVGRVSGTVTDGAFFPDGRHVLLRTYGTAAVYTFPAFVRVGELDLPNQEQGEAVAVAGPGRILVSSEGSRTDVLEVELPRSLRTEMAGGEPAPTDASTLGDEESAGPPRTDGPASDDRADDGDEPGLGRPRGYVLGVVAALLAGVAVRAARRHGRRRR